MTDRIVVLTGAGLSAESGLATFRDPDGIWAKYNIEDVATPEAFARNPTLVQSFYNERRRGLAGVKPNAAHKALADLEQRSCGVVTIVTQNIDPLHEAAGSTNLIHMHGELHKALCTACKASNRWESDIAGESVCPSCAREGTLRPDVVWFGEMPYAMEEIVAALSRCTLFVSVGTSGNVYPAAGFVQIANQAGARTVELNLEPSEGASLFDEAVHGPATTVVPRFVAELLQD